MSDRRSVIECKPDSTVAGDTLVSLGQIKL